MTTTCLFCAEPLTPHQQRAQRRYCSRTCARTHYHRLHPEYTRRVTRLAAEARRQRAYARLHGQTPHEAWSRGYRAGYTAAMRRIRGGGHAEVARTDRGPNPDQPTDPTDPGSLTRSHD